MLLCLFCSFHFTGYDITSLIPEVSGECILLPHPHRLPGREMLQEFLECFRMKVKKKKKTKEKTATILIFKKLNKM